MLPITFKVFYNAKWSKNLLFFDHSILKLCVQELSNFLGG